MLVMYFVIVEPIPAALVYQLSECSAQHFSPS
jgi:hypothetical protein